MKTKKFNIFDKHGYLPKGIHKMTLEEIEETFSKNKSLKRREIMAEYKKHLKDLIDTGYYIDHWIDGSFVTSKENPKDIDTLTEFDAIKIIENNDKEKIDKLIKEAHVKSNKLCHSFKVYRYPPEDYENYKRYLNNKRRILIILFGSDKENIPKGIVHLVRGMQYAI